MSREDYCFAADGKELNNRCLQCGYLLDAATGMDGARRPRPGDFSICVDCGGLAVFVSATELREPTPDERSMFIDENPGLIEYIKKARAEYKKQQGEA